MVGYRCITLDSYVRLKVKNETFLSNNERSRNGMQIVPIFIMTLVNKPKLVAERRRGRRHELAVRRTRLGAATASGSPAGAQADASRPARCLRCCCRCHLAVV